MSQTASPNWRRMSLRVSLSIAFGTVVVLTCVVLGCVEFLSFRSFMRADLHKRLVDVATLAARQIAPEEHHAFQARTDEESREYRCARGGSARPAPKRSTPAGPRPRASGRDGPEHPAAVPEVPRH